MDYRNIEKIAPECWRNNQLSVSRFAGGCILNGVRFILDPDTDYLVREDIYRAELKDKAKRDRVAAAEKRKWEAAQQAGLFDK